MHDLSNSIPRQVTSPLAIPSPSSKATLDSPQYNQRVHCPSQETIVVEFPKRTSKSFENSNNEICHQSSNVSDEFNLTNNSNRLIGILSSSVTSPNGNGQQNEQRQNRNSRSSRHRQQQRSSILSDTKMLNIDNQSSSSGSTFGLSNSYRIDKEL